MLSEKTFEDESLIVRTDRLRRTLIPEYATPQSAGGIASSTLNSENYISDIIDQSRGQVSIFGKMPISVYFDDPNVNHTKVLP